MFHTSGPGKRRASMSGSAQQTFGGGKRRTMATGRPGARKSKTEVLFIVVPFLPPPCLSRRSFLNSNAARISVDSVTA